jgi:N-acetylmuramoyl-L-alanine amidase-like protein
MLGTVPRNAYAAAGSFVISARHVTDGTVVTDTRWVNGDSDGKQTHRRPVVIGLVGAAALGATTVATKIAGSVGGSDPTGASSRLELSADSSDPSGVKSLTVLLGDELLPQQSAHTWRSTELATSTHSMVGFTWTGRGTPRVRIRSRVRDRWTPWRRVAVLDDVPDAGTAEASGRRGTHLVWIGGADGIHIDVKGARPQDLALVLMHPGRLAGDSDPSPTRPRAQQQGAGRKRRTVAPPAILTRAEWGANEAWRDGAPRYNTTLEQVHVHHSASGNDYTEADVPALLRGFYRYHTKSLGWSDIGYNFLVDKFGRVWEGRAGGVDKLVRGAHTLGFNATSTGICVVGNYDAVAPGAPILTAVAQVAAWKLATYGRDPVGTVAVVSEGSDKYRARKVASLPVIDGHRDTNDTACPGGLLYARLPALRTQVKQLMAGVPVAPPTVAAVVPPTITGTPAPGQPLTVTPGSYNPADATSTYAWLRNGTPIAGATAATYTPVGKDIGAALSVQVTTGHASYTALTESVAAPGAVIATTMVRAVTKRRVRNAVLRVRVSTVGGYKRPTGSVTVTVKKQTKTVPLVRGWAVVKFPRVRPGRTTATLSYAGDTGFAPCSGTAKVAVARR